MFGTRSGYSTSSIVVLAIAVIAPKARQPSKLRILRVHFNHASPPLLDELWQRDGSNSATSCANRSAMRRFLAVRPLKVPFAACLNVASTVASFIWASNALYAETTSASNAE
jgi:hypothetical protein